MPTKIRVVIAAVVLVALGIGGYVALQPGDRPGVPQTAAVTPPPLAAASQPAPAAAPSSAAPSSAPSAAAPESADPLYTERSIGRPDAPVTIYEYSSLTCPHCARFHGEIYPALKAQFIDTGRVRLVYRDYPLDRSALAASMIARCVAPERYFALLDVLFRTQAQWATSQDPARALGQHARLAGLTEAEFQSCIANQQLADFILQMRLDGERRFDVRSTPTFVINDGREKLVGVQSIEDFRPVIDRLAPPRS